MPGGPSTLEILTIQAGPADWPQLTAELQQRCCTLDTASTFAEACELFFVRGGHDLVVVGPGVQPSVARECVTGLHTVAPELPFIVFGDLALRGLSLDGQLHRLRDFHPASRAGVVAVWRIAMTLCTS